MSLQSAAQLFRTSDYTVQVDRFSGGAVVESDLPLRELRALFRVAMADWVDYVRDVKPSWEGDEGDEANPQPEQRDS